MEVIYGALFGFLVGIGLCVHFFTQLRRLRDAITSIEAALAPGSGNVQSLLAASADSPSPSTETSSEGAQGVRVDPLEAIGRRLDMIYAVVNDDRIEHSVKMVAAHSDTLAAVQTRVDQLHKRVTDNDSDINDMFKFSAAHTQRHDALAKQVNELRSRIDRIASRKPDDALSKRVDELDRACGTKINQLANAIDALNALVRRPAVAAAAPPQQAAAAK